MHRNPYTILGIPFGSSRAEANAAFARKAKALRRSGPSGMDELTDLTWALQQIDEALRHPAAAMELYRIPADPAVFRTRGEGVLRPPPERLPARPGDRAGDQAELRRRAAHEYLRHLVAIRASGLRPLP
jgi:hypothetical protein